MNKKKGLKENSENNKAHIQNVGKYLDSQE
jgi:hypothetical protein